MLNGGAITSDRGNAVTSCLLKYKSFLKIKWEGKSLHEFLVVHCRSSCSNKAKDLTKLFERMEGTNTLPRVMMSKEIPEKFRGETRARIIAQAFETRSGQTSPSELHSKIKVGRLFQNCQSCWDAGSVSSGVSSDYADTDVGSGAHCTSSDDEELYRDSDVLGNPSNHFVSQDVLKKIRECGTSVTYYGGKVVNTSNGPLVSPAVELRNHRTDFVKFRLVKSNSCDSRLELTGRLFKEPPTQSTNNYFGGPLNNLRECTIIEAPSIEITSIDHQQANTEEGESTCQQEIKRDPPVVVGTELKRDEQTRAFKADFKLGINEEAKVSDRGKFGGSALNRWQINDPPAWKKCPNFEEMEFEEFEVLEDSLNGNEGDNCK